MAFQSPARVAKFTQLGNGECIDNDGCIVKNHLFHPSRDELLIDPATKKPFMVDARNFSDIFTDGHLPKGPDYKQEHGSGQEEPKLAFIKDSSGGWDRILVRFLLAAQTFIAFCTPKFRIMEDKDRRTTDLGEPTYLTNFSPEVMWSRIQWIQPILAWEFKAFVVSAVVKFPCHLSVVTIDRLHDFFRIEDRLNVPNCLSRLARIWSPADYYVVTRYKDTHEMVEGETRATSRPVDPTKLRKGFEDAQTRWIVFLNWLAGLTNLVHRYSDVGRYCRCRIVGSADDMGFVTIEYLDYGNFAIVDVDELFCHQDDDPLVNGEPLAIPLVLRTYGKFYDDQKYDFVRGAINCVVLVEIYEVGMKAYNFWTKVWVTDVETKNNVEITWNCHDKKKGAKHWFGKSEHLKDLGERQINYSKAP